MLKGQAVGAARVLNFEGDLGIHDFAEELLLAFRINLEFRLANGLCEQLVTFAGDRWEEVWRQLVSPHVAVENFRIDGDLLVFLRGWQQRYVRVQQMHADVINAGVRGGVRQDDNPSTGFSDITDERSIPAGAAGVEDDLLVV